MTLTAHRDDPNPYTNQAVWVDSTREDSGPINNPPVRAMISSSA
jgi:hypothetical protein